MRIEMANHWGKKERLRRFKGTWNVIPIAIVIVIGRQKVFNLTIMNFSITINFSVKTK
jgi:hypothetical protein